MAGGRVSWQLPAVRSRFGATQQQSYSAKVPRTTIDAQRQHLSLSDTRTIAQCARALDPDALGWWYLLSCGGRSSDAFGCCSTPTLATRLRDERTREQGSCAEPMRKSGLNGECDDWAFKQQESGAAFFMASKARAANPSRLPCQCDQ